MKNKFSDLKPGDKVWIVYNENHKEWSYEKPYFVNEVLKPATVIKNEKVQIERYSYDRYDESVHIDLENHIEIETDIQNYQRNYGDVYDDRAKMTMTPEIWSNGPTLEVFANKEDAISFIEETCQKRIDSLKSEINKYQYQIELYEHAIINAKNV